MVSKAIYPEGVEPKPIPLWKVRNFLLIKRKYETLFPTGLLYVVEKFLNQKHHPYEKVDNRIKPNTNDYFSYYNKPTHPLRYYQNSVLEICLQNERGVIVSPTGSGKSRMIVELIKSKSLRTLIIVPSLNILDQFYDILIHHFGKKMVGKIGDQKEQINAKITIATYQSLPKIPQKFFDGIQMLITDEFHHSSASTLLSLNKKQFNNIYYRYGFTATFFRNDDSELALHGILSNVLYEYKVTQAIEDGFLTPITFFSYDYVHKTQMKQNLSWKEETERFILNNNDYNTKIANLALKTVNSGLSTIVFVNEIEHGEKLQKLIPNSVFCNGELPTKENKAAFENFNNGDLKCIIGTSIIGEGLDLVKASCAIFAGWGKSSVETVQKIGRVLRLSPGKDVSLIIDINHLNTKYLLKHSQKRMSIFKQYHSQIVTGKSL